MEHWLALSLALNLVLLSVGITYYLTRPVEDTSIPRSQPPSRPPAPRNTTANDIVMEYLKKNPYMSGYNWTSETTTRSFDPDQGLAKIKLFLDEKALSHVGYTKGVSFTIELGADKT